MYYYKLGSKSGYKISKFWDEEFQVDVSTIRRRWPQVSSGGEAAALVVIEAQSSGTDPCAGTNQIRASWTLRVSKTSY
jgi:hypothetical protein